MGVHHTRRCRNADGDDGGAPVYGSVRCPDECFDGAGPYDDQLCDGCQPVRLGRGAAFDRGACGPLWSRKGPGGRALIFALGSALTPEVATSLGLVLTIGLLSAVGAGAVSFSVLIGAVSRHVPVTHRGTAAGVINAGSSFGQFVFAPLLQTLISAFGWMAAMWSLAVITLGTLPLARFMPGSQTSAVSTAGTGGGPWAAVKDALADRSYLLLHAGFFTCGFHIAFLVTHLPSEVDMCGLPASVASWSLALIGLANRSEARRVGKGRDAWSG